MTNETPITIGTLAGEAYAAFQRVQRGDETITALKEGHDDDWIRDLVYSAHGDFGPDDWRYEAIQSALGEIHDTDGEDLDDVGSEWTDNHVDVYSGARLQWLASNLNRVGYCDEAREEGFLSAEDATILERIGIGQYMECREVFQLVRDALESRLEELSAE